MSIFDKEVKLENIKDLDKRYEVMRKTVEYALDKCETEVSNLIEEFNESLPVRVPYVVQQRPQILQVVRVQEDLGAQQLLELRLDESGLHRARALVVRDEGREGLLALAPPRPGRHDFGLARRVVDLRVGRTGVLELLPRRARLRHGLLDGFTYSLQLYCLATLLLQLLLQLVPRIGHEWQVRDVLRAQLTSKKTGQATTAS